MSDPSVTRPREGAQTAVLRALAWLLIVLGGLWTVLTGLCSTLFIGWAAWEAVSRGNMEVLSFVMIGIVCVGPGALILWAGLALRKKAKGAA